MSSLILSLNASETGGLRCLGKLKLVLGKYSTEDTPSYRSPCHGLLGKAELRSLYSVRVVKIAPALDGPWRQQDR